MTKEKKELNNSEETKKKKSTTKTQEKSSEVKEKKSTEKKSTKKEEKTSATTSKKTSTKKTSETNSEETKEIVAVVPEEKTKQVKKTPKKQTPSIPKKKLPKLFKKKYSKRQFKKSLLSKIYIEEDKKYINSIFIEKKHPKKEKYFLSIDDEKLFTPVEVKHLKELAKQIKKQKGTIKFIPLFIFIGIVASVFIFTDLILKIGLKSAFQGIFKAKVDIGYLHLDYMESSMTIKNLVVADKNAPMKNLFQFDSIVFDIDINRMLEKSIVIDEIEAAGFATGTERKTSGELVVKKKEKNENKQPLIKPEFIEAAKTKITTELQKVFAKFDPQAILNSTYNSLQTPVAAQNVTAKINEIVPYWQTKPTEFGNEVSQFITKANALSSIDFSNIKDIKTIEDNITLISETLKEGEEIKNSFNTLYTKLDSDVKTVTQITSEIEKAITADTKLAANITSSIKDFTPESGMKIITDTVEEFLNGVLGNLYPTIKEVVATVDEIKESLPQKEEKPKEEKPKVERLKGTNFYWNRPEMPKFYIGIAHASGSGFDFLANNISSNPRIINEPMTLDGTYSIAQREDTFNATLDLREDKTTPMFSASYHAPEIPTNFEFLKSDSTLDVAVTMDDNKAISISGKADISNADVIIPTFEPELAYNLCNEAISAIDETYLNVNAGFTENGSLNLKINTDFDNQFMKGVTTLVNKELSNIKDEATKAISAKLEEYTAPVKEKISEFNSYKDKINSYKKELDNKLAELKAEIEKGKQQLIDYGKEQTKNVIDDTVNKYVDTEKLNSLKNLF